MQVKWRAVYIISSIMMFLIMTLMGFAAQVSWNVVFLRAFLATIAVGVIILVLDIFINNFLLVPPEEQGEDSLTELWQNSTGAHQGNLLNITLPEESFFLDGNREEAATTEFKPFAPQQINPDVEKLINEDPLRAAEIVRKMGLE
ncbi:MAG: hypothetical protein ACYDG6_02790 [Thermincolia bacterium]